MRRQAVGTALVALLVLLAAGPREAHGDAFADALAKARRGLVERLETLATWCDGSRIAGERDRVFRLILAFDPDHVRARQGLRYARAGRGKPWVQSSEYREPPDWDKGNLKEAARRRGEAARAFLDRALAALSAAGPDVPPGRREEAVETAIDVAPDDGEIRRGRGDVERDGRWSLAETVDAAKRRAEISASVHAAEVAAPPVRTDERAIADGWPAAVATESFRALGRVDREECRRTVLCPEVGRRFLAAPLGASGQKPWPRITYLYEDREAAKKFVAKVPTWSDFAREMDEVGGGALPDGSYISYFGDAARRTSAPFASWAEREIDRLFPARRAWITQGLSQLLCWRAFRLHAPHTVSVEGTDHPQDIDAESEIPLPESTEDWMPAAAAVLARDPARRVRSLLTMDFNAFRSGDLLAAYALASYLFEGRFESLKPFLQAVAESDDPDAMCRTGLGADADVLAWRLRRFAIETASR